MKTKTPLDHSPASGRFVQTHKSFLPSSLAQKLRSSFEAVYQNPRHTHPKRFLWDHWHLENQYRMHRTPARDFFPAKVQKALENALVQFGQKHLGCHSISNPWLSYYTEGDEQNLHTDSPHGPWAYVLSLTPWEQREFRGGETLVLKPEVLNYWSSFGRSRGQESGDLFLDIPAHFNQLLVFDPRLPHGVRRVSGVHDPREGRLVVHGWFVNPEPYVTGSLKMSDMTTALNEVLPPLLATLNLPTELRGIITFRFRVSPTGRISSAKVLTNTLVDAQGESPAAELRKILRTLAKMRLPKARGASELTLPLIFD
jgi:hypothetical protein